MQNTILTDQKIIEKLKKIKLLLLDVDGVLTDGSIIYNDNDVETKTFNVKDGLGIRILMKQKIDVAIITGRSSRALYRRCEDLGIKFIFDGIKDKAEILSKITMKTGIAPQNMAFICDDLPDILLMKKIGLSVAVSDAHKAVIDVADMVTTLKGGYGAVREICEAILIAQGFWGKIMGSFIKAQKS